MPPTTSNASRRNTWQAPIANSTSHDSPSPWPGVDAYRSVRFRTRPDLAPRGRGAPGAHVGRLPGEHRRGERDRLVLDERRHEPAQRPGAQARVAVEHAHPGRPPDPDADVATPADPKVRLAAHERDVGTPLEGRWRRRAVVDDGHRHVDGTLGEGRRDGLLEDRAVVPGQDHDVDRGAGAHAGAPGPAAAVDLTRSRRRAMSAGRTTPVASSRAP